MPDAPDPPPPGPPTATAPHDVPTQHRQFVARERRLMLVQRLLTLGIILTICAFLLVILLGARERYRPERFREPLLAEARELGPQVARRLADAFADARPALTDLARARWEQLRPELGEVTEREFATFREDLARRMERQLVGVIREALAAREARLEEELQALADDDRRRVFRERLEERLLASTQSIAERAYAANREEIEKMLISIDGFREDNPYLEMEPDQLTRHYLHNWLMIVDYHIMHSTIEGVL